MMIDSDNGLVGLEKSALNSSLSFECKRAGAKIEKKVITDTKYTIR